MNSRFLLFNQNGFIANFQDIQGQFIIPLLTATSCLKCNNI